MKATIKKTHVSLILVFYCKGLYDWEAILTEANDQLKSLVEHAVNNGCPALVSQLVRFQSFIHLMNMLEMLSANALVNDLGSSHYLGIKVVGESIVKIP